MVNVKNKRLSFKKIWLNLGRVAKNNIVDGFIHAGFALSTLYSDKDGRTVINEERKELYESLFSKEGVPEDQIWD